MKQTYDSTQHDFGPSRVKCEAALPLMSLKRFPRPARDKEILNRALRGAADVSQGQLVLFNRAGIRATCSPGV